MRSLHGRLEEVDEACRVAQEKALHPEINEDVLMERVGEETAAILRSARAAAADMRTRAAEESARVVEEAHQRAGETRSDAEAAMSRSVEEANRSADDIRSAAQAAADQLVERARQEGETLRQMAEQERKLTIEGAQAIREKVLADLNARRRVATVQIDQLRAGRERLVESYGVVRRTLEEVHDELQRADTDARQVADQVGRGWEDRELPDLPPDLLRGPASEAAEAAEPAPAVPGDVPTAENEVVDASWPPVGAIQPERAPLGGARRRARQGRGGRPVRRPVRRPASRRRATPGDAMSTPVGVVAPVPGADSVPEIAEIPEAVVLGEEGPEIPEAPGSADFAEAGQPTESGEAVEGLFARIRASREGALLQARQVLGDESGAPAARGQAAVISAPRAGDVDTGVGSVGDGGESGRGGGPAEGEDSERSGDDEAHLERREAALGDIEVILTRKLKRALQDEQNDLLDRLRSSSGQPDSAALLGPVAEHRQRYVDAALPQLELAARAGSRFAVEVIKAGGHHVASPKRPTRVDDLAGELAATLSDQIRRRVERAVAPGMGDDPSVLIEALGAAYRETKTQRIERNAGDQVTAAFSKGTWETVGDRVALRWVVEDIDGPCADCDDNALAGSLPRHEGFPTGQAHPPAHAGCRCLLVPAPT